MLISKWSKNDVKLGLAKISLRKGYTLGALIKLMPISAQGLIAKELGEKAVVGDKILAEQN